MKMQKTAMEFVTFETQDIITTSGGGFSKTFTSNELGLRGDVVMAAMGDDSYSWVNGVFGYTVEVRNPLEAFYSGMGYGVQEVGKTAENAYYISLDGTEDFGTEYATFKGPDNFSVDNNIIKWIESYKQ